MRDTGNFHKGLRGIIAITIISAFIALSAATVIGAETKTAYTRDGIHFVSQGRMEENIRYEYAKPGDYREVQVSMDTVVVGESIIPENVPQAKIKNETRGANNSSSGSRTASRAADSTDSADSSSQGKYPYAPVSIALLVLAGLAFAGAGIFSGRGRR